MLPGTKEAFYKWAEEFSKALSSSEATPLNENLQRAILFCMGCDMNNEPIPSEVMSSFKNDGIGQLAKARCQYLGLQISDACLLYICSAFHSPGNIVMILSVLYWVQVTKNISLITMDEIVELMPWGLPTSETMLKYWDAQKVYRINNDTDNLLDCLKSFL